MDKCSSVRSFASLVLPLCLSLTSCSGGNDSSSAITFGGAKCESGVTFAGGSELGYDYLYNFERQLNQNVHVIFDTSHQAQECSNLLTPSQVLPWVRVDYKNSASPSPNDLTFELVEPGGRNSSTLATYDIPDSSKQSIHGAFGYEIRPDISSDYGQVTCEGSV
jgi:hypothetical protein